MSKPLTIPPAPSLRRKSGARGKSRKPSGPGAKEVALEPGLLEMVRLRVAQLCSCQACVDAHAEALRAQGESDERIRQLPSWRESRLYTERERTALAVSEALGSSPSGPVSRDIVRQARSHFNDAEILQLTLTIFAVTDWNYLCAH